MNSAQGTRKKAPSSSSSRPNTDDENDVKEPEEEGIIAGARPGGDGINMATTSDDAVDETKDLPQAQEKHPRPRDDEQSQYKKRKRSRHDDDGNHQKQQQQQHSLGQDYSAIANLLQQIDQQSETFSNKLNSILNTVPAHGGLAALWREQTHVLKQQQQQQQQQKKKQPPDHQDEWKEETKPKKLSAYKSTGIIDYNDHSDDQDSDNQIVVLKHND